jgi:hypothetical protein
MFFYSLEYTKYNLYKVKAGIMMGFNIILIIKDNSILFYNCINKTISSFISITISTITLIILLFIVENKQ